MSANIGGRSDWWESKCKALAEAFRNLPNRKDVTGPGIPYDLLIGDFGRELMLMRPAPSRAIKRPTEELRDLAKWTGRALKSLDSLSPYARNALNYNKQRVTLERLRFNLMILHAAAELADKPKKNKPEKIQERRIARVVAQYYHGLTGRQPTVSVSIKRGHKASGAFLQLLREVYNILGVAASAESQAKVIAKEWRERDKEKTSPKTDHLNSFSA
jgi:hypothetical protein